jgi:hypothetical protein
MIPKVNRLDVLAESRPLSPQEKESFSQAPRELNDIWAMEEIKAR